MQLKEHRPMSDVDAVEEERILRVSNKTETNELGAAIYTEWVETGEFAPVRAIGVVATTQACKGLAVAAGRVAARGRSLGFTVGFDVVKGRDGEDMTALTFYPFLR